MRGDASPEAVAEVAAGMRRWVSQTSDDPLPLNRMHGLGSPLATRMALRNSLVTDASMLHVADLLESGKNLPHHPTNHAIRFYENECFFHKKDFRLTIKDYCEHFLIMQQSLEMFLVLVGANEG